MSDERTSNPKVARHWTVSRLKDFETCPARYDYAHNQKAKGLPAPAADRGTLIHDSIDQYLRGLCNTLHEEIAPSWAQQIYALKAISATSEEMWELAEGWHPMISGDSNEPLWWRGKIDAHYLTKDGVLHIIDYKTGKPYKANAEQLEVYALAGFAMFDEVNIIDTALWYLDSDEPHEKTFKRDQAPKLARKWEGRAKPLLEATTFPHKPGNHCGWCPFRKICPQAA